MLASWSSLPWWLKVGPADSISRISAALMGCSPLNEGVDMAAKGLKLGAGDAGAEGAGDAGVEPNVKEVPEGAEVEAGAPKLKLDV